MINLRNLWSVKTYISSIAVISVLFVGSCSRSQDASHRDVEAVFVAETLATKKKYKCKICDWPSHCNLERADDCSWKTFYEGDSDTERLCCPGTKHAVD